MKTEYGRVSKQTIEELRTILGGDCVSTKEHELEEVFIDIVGGRSHGGQ